MRTDRRPQRNCAGLSLIEALIGTFIVVVLFIAVWFHYAHTQEIWKRGRDKVQLQQAISQVSEAIGRDARAGAGVVVSSASDITIVDRYGNAIRRYYHDGANGLLLMTGGDPVVPEKCTAVTFTLAADSTQLRYLFTLEDSWLNRATIRGSASLRNLSED